VSSEPNPPPSPLPSPHALAPGTQLRDYTIVGVIGTGGFSIVYKAIDNSLQREVAIKEYFPGAMALRGSDSHLYPHSRDAASFSKGIEGFLNEGKLLAAFDHAALVRVYRCWEERGTAYLAMRLYTGSTLREAVLGGQWQSDEKTLQALLSPLCDALELLHAAQCYHRDVAPDNIMLVDSGTPGAPLAPVLLDFGAARKAIEHTQVFTAILKPGYAPIEQYGDGELKQGPWTDIYALAGVVHFTLAGGPPPTAVNRMIRDGMPRPRTSFAGRLPEHWLDAIETGLAVRPADRPASIDEFRALFRWDETTTTVATLVSAPLPAPASAPAPEVASKANATPPTPSAKAPSSPSAPTPSVIPPVAVPEDLLDDQRTVVTPRHSNPTVVTPPLAETAAPPATSAPGKKPRLLWLAGAGALALGALLAWRQGSAPVNTTPTNATTAPSSAAPVATPGAVAPSAPSNDMFDSNKTSLPTSGANVAPTAAPPSPLPSPAAPDPLPAAKPVVKTKPATANKANEPKTEVNTPVKVQPPAPVLKPTEADYNAPAYPSPSNASNASKRPERCAALIDRYGVGEPLSADEQRFIRERCK
jgi:serine/threonine protein kinase